MLLCERVSSLFRNVTVNSVVRTAKKRFNHTLGTSVFDANKTYPTHVQPFLDSCSSMIVLPSRVLKTQINNTHNLTSRAVFCFISTALFVSRTPNHLSFLERRLVVSEETNGTDHTYYVLLFGLLWYSDVCGWKRVLCWSFLCFGSSRFVSFEDPTALVV